MRVTDAMLYSNADISIDAARSQVNTATEESSSGLAFEQPGQDPAGAAGVIVHSTAGAYASAIAASASSASDELSIASSALTTVSNALAQATQVAIQLTNDSNNAADRQNGAAEVGQVFQEVIAALNTKSGDRYIFGGSQDQKPPFDASGNYDGDTEVRTIEVAPGVEQATSVRADVALKGTGGGVDVLGALSDLQTALENNDAAGIQTALSSLETGTQQVSVLVTQVGADQDALQAASTLATTASTAETKSVSTLQNADVVNTATALQLAETALQSAITASTDSFKFSLLDASSS